MFQDDFPRRQPSRTSIICADGDLSVEKANAEDDREIAFSTNVEEFCELAIEHQTVENLPGGSQ